MVMNTKQDGHISILILQNRKTHNYLGIVYEFAIVLEGKNREQLQKDLLEASKGYLKVVQRDNLSDSLLDKSDMLPTEYKQLFEETRTRINEKKTHRKLSPEYEKAIQTGNAQLSMACLGV